ncbi:hypothetical protein BAR24066_06937 [Burkholderia arboris]|uniref:Uncharacterized protein n=1 Tax=Burkholderia arboris TaxID=488730 RepID=A0A9Q9UUQ6_9BURK|nr:hypothetical protein BAR24066_06937 [Burkholderia arboris]
MTLTPNPFPELLHLIVAGLRHVGQTEVLILLLNGMVTDRMDARNGINKLFLAQLENAVACQELSQPWRPFIDRALFERMVEVGLMPPLHCIAQRQLGIF